MGERELAEEIRTQDEEIVRLRLACQAFAAQEAGLREKAALLDGLIALAEKHEDVSLLPSGGGYPWRVVYYDVDDDRRVRRSGPTALDALRAALGAGKDGV